VRSTTVIDKILTNEKYIGDALLQKTYTVDFLTKKKVMNRGSVSQYYIEEDHEAIIPKELFRRVQEEKPAEPASTGPPSGKRRGGQRKIQRQVCTV
jgi:site-specific DNA recombinase